MQRYLWSHVSDEFPIQHPKGIIGNRMEGRTENIYVPLWKVRVCSHPASWWEHRSLIRTMVWLEEREDMDDKRYEGSSDWTDPRGLWRWRRTGNSSGHRNEWAINEMEVWCQQRSACSHCTELNCPRVQGSLKEQIHRGGCWVPSQWDRPAKGCWTLIKHLAQKVPELQIVGAGVGFPGKIAIPICLFILLFPFPLVTLQ